MDRYLNAREFLANTTLKLVNLGYNKIKVSSFFNIKSEFENLLKTHKIESVVFLHEYSIKSLADKFFTFLNLNEEKQILKITNEDLAKMWLADFAVKDATYRKYLNSAIMKVLNEKTNDENNENVF